MFNLKEEIYLGGLDLETPLPKTERYLGSDLFSRSIGDRVIVYYLDSSDQIEIPGGYLSLFSFLGVRIGDRLREEGPEFLSLGINLPGIFFHKTDSRGIRNLLSRMVIIGTSELRDILPPWTLSNINDTIEI